MVSTRSPTSKSSRPFNNPLVTVSKAPITFGIIATFMFHSFFQFSSKVEVLISLFTFFYYHYSRTLLSILVDFYKAVVWMASTCPLISKSSTPFTNSLGIAPSAPTTIGITVAFVFHRFFFSSLTIIFPLWSAGKGMSTIWQFFFFFFYHY